MFSRLNNYVYAIIVFTLATAAIHLFLAYQYSDMLFLLNGLGYIALLIALYFLPLSDSLRKLVRWAFMLFTAVTIILFFVFNGAGAFSSPLGLFDKGLEIALLIFLWLDRAN